MVNTWELAARAAGWEKRGSHFTRCGVSIAYIDWKTLCVSEGIAEATPDDYEALQALISQNEMIQRANAEIDTLRAAGHQANGRLMAQGVEIEIVRKGWNGPERSYLIVTPNVDARP